MHQNQIDFKSYLKNKKVLALSDTGYPHKHIKDFCKELSESIVDVYVSPATTSGFLKVYMSFSGNKRKKKITLLLFFLVQK
jgi:soluble P-type ATPase